jgi:hypothetical protein
LILYELFISLIALKFYSLGYSEVLGAEFICEIIANFGVLLVFSDIS